MTRTGYSPFWTPGTSTPGGGSAWVGPIAIAHGDFVAGTNGYYIPLLNLSDGWIITNVIASVSVAFSAAGSSHMYFGVDISDFNNGVPTEAWLNPNVVFNLDTTDDNSILSGHSGGVTSEGNFPWDLRMMGAINGDDSGYLAAAVKGDGHVLQMWCGTAVSAGVGAIWVEYSAPTAP